MRRTLNIFVLLFALTTASAFGDVFHFLDGKRSESHWVAAIIGGETPELLLHSASPGRIDIHTERKVELKLIRAVEVREQDDDAELPAGRVAHVRMANGATNFNCVVHGFWRTDSTFVCRLQPTDGATSDVDLVEISEIRFSPPDLSLVSALAPAPAGGAPGLGGEDDSYLSTPGSGPPPVAGGQAAPPVDPMQDFDSFVTQLATEHSKPGRSAVLIDPLPQKNPFGFEAMGGFLILTIMGAVMAFSFVTGTFVLLFSAKNEGIGDLTVGRAIGASAMLSIIPPGLFVLCFTIIPIFIGIKLFAGVLAFYYSARIIVMGFLEVMESKATDVMISYYAMLVFVMMVVWLYMKYA